MCCCVAALRGSVSAWVSTGTGRYVLDVAPRSSLTLSFLGLDMTTDYMVGLWDAAPAGKWTLTFTDGLHLRFVACRPTHACWSLVSLSN